MKNGDDKAFNSQISYEDDENLNIDQISQSKNNLYNKENIYNAFEEGLNISDIVNNNNIENKTGKNIKNNNPFENASIDKSFGDDLDNLNKINITNEDINDSSIQNIQLELNNQKNNNDDNKNTKKIRTKDDLNNTPIPVFECLYCCKKDKIVFQHFINERLSKKYLLQASIYDINDLDKLICNKRINKDEKNEILFNLVIKNTEYINMYIPKEKSINYFKSNIYNNLCQKYEIDNHRLLKQKIEDSIVRKKKDFYFKGINKIPRNSMNNKCLFNSTNSLINNFNALSGLVEPVPQINVNNNNLKNNYTIVTCSNNSINFNSLSLNNNEFNCYCKDNNNMLDYIVEKIEKNDESVNYADDKEEILDFFKFDLSRKITRKDLKWENKYYNIWDPDISSDFDENDNDENEYKSQIKINKINEENKNKSINININNQYIIKKNKNISINKSMGYIKYNISKKNNLIFTFNKNKEKKTNKIQFNEINKDKKNKKKIDKDKNNNNKNCSIKNNKRNKSKEKDIKFYHNNINKSITNININKSQDLNKYINNYYNYNNNNSINKHKKLLSSLSYMKSVGSTTTHSNYNINKSANILGKSRQKLNYNNKRDNHNNTKSLQYISSNKNNSSANYSIGVSINLKTNLSIKSNGIIHCWKPEKISYFHINEKNNNNKNVNNKQKINQNLSTKNQLFNIFNNLNSINLNQTRPRAKSNYISNNNSKNIYKNQNKKNNYKIYKINKSNNSNSHNIFNYSIDKEKEKGNKIINRTNDLLYSSNSIFNNLINNHDCLYRKSLGLSFGSNENNLSDNNITNVVFNSVSNINKNNSNLNISTNNYSKNSSPYKFNRTSYYYNRNNKEMKNKINNLIDLIKNKPYNNNSHEFYYLNKNNNISNFKNKSINCFNSTSFLEMNNKSKKEKNISTNKSYYS